MRSYTSAAAFEDHASASWQRLCTVTVSELHPAVREALLQLGASDEMAVNRALLQLGMRDQQLEPALKNALVQPGTGHETKYVVVRHSGLPWDHTLPGSVCFRRWILRSTLWTGFMTQNEQICSVLACCGWFPCRAWGPVSSSAAYATDVVIQLGSNLAAICH